MVYDFRNLTVQNYDEFTDYLKAISEEKYRDFMASLTPDIEVIYGVRAPLLKSFAKEINKNANVEGLKMLLLNGISHEEKLIYIYMIAGTNYNDYETFIKDVEGFIPRINNWAVNDSLSNAIKKNARKFEQEYFEYIRKNLKSENPWRVRFGLTSLKSAFTEKEYIDEIIRLVSMVKSEHYYVNMGVAWLLSTCYIKDSKKIKTFLGNNVLDKWVQNKTVQKIVESTRVSAEDKILIKKYKV